MSRFQIESQCEEFASFIKMAHETLLLALVMTAFLSVQGYPYFISSSLSTKKLCLTNSPNTVAFIYKLKNATKLPLNQTRIARDPNKFQDLSAYNCEMNSDKCGGWIFQNTELLVNLKSGEFNDPFELIEESRWNNLPVIRTDGAAKYSDYVNLGQPSKVISMHLSILAVGNVYIMFTKHKHWKNNDGFVIEIDAGEKHETSIKKCDKVTEFKSWQSCNNGTVKNTDFFSKGQRWLHATIRFDTEHSILELYANKEVYLSKRYGGKFIDRERDSLEVGMAFASLNNNAFFKLHKYNYRLVEKNGFVQSPQIELKKPREICVQLTFSSKSIENAKLTIKNKNDATVFEERLISDKWETRKFVTPVLAKGYYRIIIKGGPMSIGSINFCNPEEGDQFLTSTDDENAISCEVLGLNEEKYIQIFKQMTESISPIFNSKEERILICGSAGHEDCFGVSACGLKGCFCISGHEIHDKKCQTECLKGYFGVKCVETVDHCKEDSYDKHTGECFKGCVSNYRQPFCKTELLSFDTHPRIVDVRAYAVTISLKDALSEILQKKREQSDQFWKTRQVLIQVSIIGDSGNWKNIPERFNLQAPDATLYIKGLQQNTDYKVKAIIVEDGQQMGRSSPNQNFSTPRCTPLDEKHTLLLVLNNKLQIKRAVFEDQGCHITEYSVSTTADDKIIFKNNILSNEPTYALELPELTDSVEYDISIIAEDNSRAHIRYTYNSSSSQHDVLTISIAVISSSILILACLYMIYKKSQSKNIRIPSVHYYADAGNVTFVTNIFEEEDNCSSPPAMQKYTPVSVSKLLNYVESSSSSGYLTTLYETIPRGQTKTWLVGKEKRNVNKNRYTNALAYDSTRVVLRHPEAWDYHNMSDYINANYIDGYNKPKAYIATQGPLAHTSIDFWRMIWQDQVTLIVMVTNLIEDGKHKCDKYWPDYPSTIQFGNICVTNENDEEFVDHVVRYFCVSNSLINRRVVHLHYTAWPFNKVPTHALSVANFCKKVQKVAQGEAPITVHCSAGVGRTGTIILIDACLQMAAAEGAVDPRGLLAAMRAQRLNMVDNELQFEFVHWVLVEVLTVTQFAVPDRDFLGEYGKLLARNKLKLSKQYSTLCSLCDFDWRKVEKSTMSSFSPANNRFSGIHTDYGCVVKIFEKDGVTLSPVNAIYLSSCVRKNHYIVTETPLPNTVHLFWQMIAQFQIERVIILNEAGPAEESYLPNRDDTVKFDNLSVVLKCKSKKPNYKINTYRTYLNGQEGKTVNFIRISGWEVGVECGIPVNMLIKIWEETDRMKSGDVTLVVCHDGVTASGLFLAAGFALEQIKIEKQVDVATVVRTLRQIRPKFITGQSQYEFLHRVAHDYLHTRDSGTYDVIY